MRSGNGPTHGAEFGGVWVVIGAGRLADLARAVVLNVMAVGVTIILILKNATRVGLGVASGVWHCIRHCIKCGRAVGSLLHVMYSMLVVANFRRDCCCDSS